MTILYSGAWIPSKVPSGYLSPCLDMALRPYFRYPGIWHNASILKQREEFLSLIQKIRLWYVSLEFTETCPKPGLGSQAAPCEDTDLPCPVGLSTGPGTFHRLRSCVGGSRIGVGFCGCQKTRWVGIILVCICVKLKQCREKWGCCVYLVCTLTVHEQAAFHCLAAEYVISPGKG